MSHPLPSAFETFAAAYLPASGVEADVKQAGFSEVHHDATGAWRIRPAEAVTLGQYAVIPGFVTTAGSGPGIGGSIKTSYSAPYILVSIRDLAGDAIAQGITIVLQKIPVNG
jgi:hypothetical protein